jgi:hypothetical protein
MADYFPVTALIGYGVREGERRVWLQRYRFGMCRTVILTCAGTSLFSIEKLAFSLFRGMKCGLCCLRSTKDLRWSLKCVGTLLTGI